MFEPLKFYCIQIYRNDKGAHQLHFLAQEMCYLSNLTSALLELRWLVQSLREPPVLGQQLRHLKLVTVSSFCLFTFGCQWRCLSSLWARLFKTNDIVSYVSLKFQMLISEICQFFFVAKASLIFSTKNISAFGYEVVKHLTS